MMQEKRAKILQLAAELEQYYNSTSEVRRPFFSCGQDDQQEQHQ